MKTILAILAALFLLAGCGGSDANDDDGHVDTPTVNCARPGSCT